MRKCNKFQTTIHVQVLEKYMYYHGQIINIKSACLVQCISLPNVHNT